MIPSASSPSPRANFSKCLILAVITAVAWLPISAQTDAPPMSQAEVDELERGLDRPTDEEMAAAKSGGPIECGDDYCSGLYDDLIKNLWIRFDGQIAILITPEVTPFLVASSLACARDYYLIVAFESESSATKRAASQHMATQLQVARALGNEVRIEWVQSNFNPSWMVCKVSRILV